MNYSSFNNRSRLFILSVISVFSSALYFAQDATVTKSTKVTTTTTEEWQTNPTYWIMGGVVLLVIIAIVAMSGRNKNK